MKNRTQILEMRNTDTDGGCLQQARQQARYSQGKNQGGLESQLKHDEEKRVKNKQYIQGWGTITNDLTSINGILKGEEKQNGEKKYSKNIG